MFFELKFMHLLPFSQYEKLYKKGFGLRYNDNLLISDFELFFSLEQNLLDDHQKEKIKKEIKSAKEFAKKNKEVYEVFKFLRKNGYIARETLDIETNELYLLCSKKGYRQERDITKFIIKVFGTNDEIKLEKITNDVKMALEMKKSLVYAIVKNREKNQESEEIDDLHFYGIISMKFD
jgi:tRNA splicing endonuclease